MDFQPINPNVVPLLSGLKPYLGVKGQIATEGISSFINVLSSKQGQEAIRTMSQIFKVTGKGDKVYTVNTPAGPVTFSLGIAFTLFLILILLILSGSLLAMGSALNTSYTDSSSSERELSPVIEDDTLI